MENFSIFKNTKKVEGSNQPDYNVSARTPDGFMPWGACWIKEGNKVDEKGNKIKYMSCSISKPKEEPKKEVTSDFGTF